MVCDRCGDEIPTGDEMDYYGQSLCEDCYIKALSPAQGCDPWAVRSAQSLSQLDEGYAQLSETHTSILQVLEETGGIEAEVIAERLNMKMPDLQREFATLRHMEKVRGEMRGSRKVMCLW